MTTPTVPATTSAPPTTPAAFAATAVSVPGDGYFIGSHDLIINGTNMVNAELLPGTGYVPRYASFSIVPAGTQATLTLTAAQFKGQTLTMRASVFDVPPGGSGNEIVAFSRRWTFVVDTSDLPYRDPSDLAALLDNPATTQVKLANDWPSIAAILDAHVPPGIIQLPGYGGTLGGSYLAACRRDHTWVACQLAFQSLLGAENSKPH